MKFKNNLRKQIPEFNQFKLHFAKKKSKLRFGAAKSNSFNNFSFKMIFRVLYRHLFQWTWLLHYHANKKFYVCISLF